MKGHKKMNDAPSERVQQNGCFCDVLNEAILYLSLSEERDLQQLRYEVIKA